MYTSLYKIFLDVIIILYITVNMYYKIIIMISVSQFSYLLIIRNMQIIVVVFWKSVVFYVVTVIIYPL